jgi:hypothetical protein
MTLNPATLLLIILVTLQGLDMLTTYHCLEGGKGTEANGLLAPLFKRFGVLPMLIVVKGAFVALLVWGHGQLPIELLILMTLFYGWVVYNNIQVLRK